MNKLSENSIKKAEIREKQYKIYDGEGMFLLVHPNGSKYWRMKYTFDGKSKLASFGVWPRVSLKEARELRHEARQKIKMGIIPVAGRVKNKQYHSNRTQDTKVENLKLKEVFRIFHHFLRIPSLDKKMESTEASLNLLKSCIFGSSENSSELLFEKKELKKIFTNLYKNRGELFDIVCNYFFLIPILNLVVLYLVLLVVMGFFPALLTLVMYLIITVCVTFALCLWEEKNGQE